MDGDCPKFRSLLAELDVVAPGAPLLGLGQTVFWDEPMKAGVALALARMGGGRRFVAGVHDTDYFAKFAASGSRSGYAALAHNDTTTKSLWSAAGEFSRLFGSETVVTREKLQGAGGKLGRVEAERPGFLDEVTEAWGWRGVVSLNRKPRITAEKRTERLFPHLYDTLAWAGEGSLELVSGSWHGESLAAKERLLALVCDGRDVARGSGDEGLGGYYEVLLKGMYELVAGEGVEMETTRTTRLLRFNRATVGLPRFDVARLFVDPGTRERAVGAYNAALAGSEIYGLDRFGTGALPFDLYIPGRGRGTLRLGNRGGVVMTDPPVGFSLRKPVESLEELAGVVEAKFGRDCVLVGKAVALILMLGREFVFVFHEGASGYVGRSGVLARALGELGTGFRVNPILRVGLSPWDAMDECCAWLKLPEPLRRPFGTDELSGPSFARRWREVGAEQRGLLGELAGLRRPLDLVRWLAERVGGTWNCLAREYEGMQGELAGLAEELGALKRRKREALIRLKRVKAEKSATEVAKGRHWRGEIFEREGDLTAAWAQRARYESRFLELAREEGQVVAALRGMERAQEELVGREGLVRMRRRRGEIALEAELMRLRLAREAVIASEGLENAGRRPSAWWFPLVCPEGRWYRATMERAEYRLEHLS